MEHGTPASGATRLLGLLGWPVAHSLSPAMHNAAFQALALDYRYVAFPVAPEPVERLGEAVRGMRALGIRGCSVTAPYKESVVAHVDVLTDFAKLVKAVNTLWVDDDGRVWGDNTDGPGFVAYAEHAGVRVEGAGALVLGAGGSARAVAAGLMSAGCARVTVLNRTVARAEALVEELGAGADPGVLRAGRFPQDVAACSRDATLIVQCTTVGMGDDAASLAWDRNVSFRRDQAVCDLVYHPRRTALLEKAAAEGAAVLGGVGVLVFQGAIAFERWTGRPAPVDVMLRAVGV